MKPIFYLDFDFDDFATGIDAIALVDRPAVDRNFLCFKNEKAKFAFDDAKHLCSWCGLSPANNESAGKKKSVRIAKAGDYLKPMMVQCALAAIKSKKQPYFAIKYGRIKKRRGHKKAIIAIARMMMVCIYHMVSEKKPFTPTDYEELMDPQNHVESVVLNENNVFAYLESLGYDSSKLVKRNDN